MVTRNKRALPYLALSMIILAGCSRGAFARTTEEACWEQATTGDGAAAAKRPLTTRDLVRLRDIGSVYPLPGAPMFTVSPDGKEIAFQVRQADPDHNRYCIGVFISSVHSPGLAREIDHGGDLLLDRSDQLGRANLAVGTPRTITPKWAPDGTWVAFLKRVDGITQVWRAQADGSGSRPLTDSSADIDDFAIGKDGTTLVYVYRPDIMQARSDIETEGNTGFHYDERFFPSASSTPFPRSGITKRYDALDLRTNHTMVATQPQIAELNDTVPQGYLAAPRAHGGRPVWRITPNTGFPARSRLAIENAVGSIMECSAAACLGEQSVMWSSPDLQRIYFIRREGWAASITVVYVWEPGSDRTRPIYRTTDLLYDCVAPQDESICAIEGSVQPRRIVKFTEDFKNTTILFDPNPEFSGLATGRIERLKWTNSFGLKVFGDLVYPTHYSRDKRYPLVITQYTSRGFLRGGTGDEVPIQALSNRGFAVLSLQRPSPLPLARGAQDAYEVDRMLLRDLRDRRSVLSAIESAVQQLVRRGIVDKRRIGISGLSDGSSTVQFAALNSNIFAAGSVSGCCWEPNQEVVLGQAIGNHFKRSGWPRLSGSSNRIWDRLSISKNARRVRFPLLMQMADEEYLMALESFTALKEAGKPVDLFVFPHEHHFKWQASHRQAVYDRNVAWFEFWLKAKISVSGPFAGEAKRWEAMKLADRRGPG